ncbi:MAG: hypothetical protein IJE02_07595 [Clostridia bacterium]|nr:hypothetical protein [Clostridia bacterium]
MKNKVVKHFCFIFCMLLVLSSVGCKSEDCDISSSMNSFSQSISINNTSDSASDNSSATINETDPNYYDILRPWYNIGHNKQLRGTPIIYAIFMDDDESSWDTASIEMFLSDEIDPAVRYLESEAKKWQVDLNLSVKSFATVLNQGYTLKYEGVVNRNLRQSPSTKDVLEKAAMDFGYSSEETLQETISLSNGGKEIIFLCIFNKDGTCYTRNQAANGSTTLVEKTILFRRPLNHPERVLKKGQRVSVIAHEILHLFGAEDFYLTSSRENLAEQYYPNDIMLWQYANISDNTLGDCVAYSIGWTNTTPKV